MTRRADLECHVDLVTAGVGARLLEECDIGALSGRVFVQYSAPSEVLSDGAPIVGKSRRSPLDAMDGRAFPRERRQHRGPFADALILVGRTEKSEAMPSD
jgi:hypothetical protein